MITESNQTFRITYEAFSKFSNSLNRCKTFDDIAQCFSINLKYLLNYHIYRASYCRNGSNVHLETVGRDTTVAVSEEPEYLEYEKILFNSGIPQRWTDVRRLSLPVRFLAVEEELPELWGWKFMNDDRQIVISVLAGSRRQFSKKDINFLKLVSDNLETKLHELCLIKELDSKNNIISSINEDQKEVIRERTREIEEKNKTLLEISVLNAHRVREPLSRVLGLVNLLDSANLKPDELFEQVIPLIKTSAEDLDAALQTVIDRATKDLRDLKA